MRTPEPRWLDLSVDRGRWRETLGSRPPIRKVGFPYQWSDYLQLGAFSRYKRKER
jgi:hypothetical protein